MSLLTDTWAWIAQHPIFVIAVAVGLIAVGFAVVWLRKRSARRHREAVRPSLRFETPMHCEPVDPEWAEAARRVREASEQHRREALEHADEPASPAPQAVTLGALRAHEKSEEVDAALRGRISKPTDQEVLAIEAGRLAYQIPERMWVGVQETVEVRLGALIANEFMQGFVGRGDVKLQDVPIVETMSVSLVCEPGAFDIETRSQEVQLVKPDLVKGTAFHQSDFARWTWLVTPRQRGKHTLLVKVSAALRDSRGLPTTSSLPDKIIAVTVRVHLARAAVGAVGYLAPLILSGVVTALVGVFTKDYWWPAIRSWLGL